MMRPVVVKEKQLNAKNQEESYKNQLNIQNKKKKDIIEEIKLLEKKLELYNHEKKLNELKMKEIKKIKNELNKNKLKEKNDLNLQKIKPKKHKKKLNFNIVSPGESIEIYIENILRFKAKQKSLEQYSDTKSLETKTDINISIKSIKISFSSLLFSSFSNS